MQTLLNATVALLLGYLLYSWLAAQHLDLFMFSIGTFDSLVGEWSGVIGYVYGSFCSLGSVALLRWFIRLQVPDRLAVRGAVALALLLAVAAVAAVLAVVTSLLTVLGVFALFFHSGDR